MAQAANVNIEPRRPQPAPVVPMPIEVRRPRLTRIRHAAASSYAKVKARASGVSRSVAQEAKAFGRGVKSRVQRARVEKPLQLVAMTAGAGTLLGAVLQVWRSKHYE
jgi:ElaB/YqjD/DUF883 family membrane-anchored ribosome-binding protein